MALHAQPVVLCAACLCEILEIDAPLSLRIISDGISWSSRIGGFQPPCAPAESPVKMLDTAAGGGVAVKTQVRQTRETAPPLQDAEPISAQPRRAQPNLPAEMVDGNLKCQTLIPQTLPAERQHRARPAGGHRGGGRPRGGGAPGAAAGRQPRGSGGGRRHLLPVLHVSVSALSNPAHQISGQAQGRTPGCQPRGRSGRRRHLASVVSGFWPGNQLDCSAEPSLALTPSLTSDRRIQ